MLYNPDPQQEGHTREWADRARVEMDPNEDAKKSSSPKQSPDDEDVQEQSNNLQNKKTDEPSY